MKPLGSKNGFLVRSDFFWKCKSDKPDCVDFSNIPGIIVSKGSQNTELKNASAGDFTSWKDAMRYLENNLDVERFAPVYDTDSNNANQ